MLLLASTSATAQKYAGGDISMLPKYEEAGAKYFSHEGEGVSDVLTFFKEQGMNAMRVRLFVDPKKQTTDNGKWTTDENVCQDLDWVKTLGKRIKDKGLKFMLDFHYSDTWADPGKQFTPKAWMKCSPAQLCDSVYEHTAHALRHLKQNGCAPDLIQVGNEITFGMLWPTAKTDPFNEKNWDVLTDLLKSGVKACREVCPDARIIIHTEHAGDWDATKNYYMRLRNHAVDYDIIGLSYYPMWHKDIPNLSRTLDSLAVEFPKKDIMIVETAFYYSHDNDRWAKSADEHSDLYPITEEGQAQFTQELVDMLKKHPMVKGLYWWFPEENESGKKVIGSWINRGLFDNHTGKVLKAMKSFAAYRINNKH